MMLTLNKNVILVISAIIFSIIIAETYLYVENKTTSSDYVTWSKLSDYPSKYFVQPLEFGLGALPGVYNAHKITNKGKNVFDVQYHIGSDGFRVTEKTSALNRVNFFGGSYTFGEALKSSDTLPQQFQKLSPNYNVKNFGFHGWGVVEALAILESNHDTKGDINFLLTAPWHAGRMRCIQGESSSSKPVFKINKHNEMVRAGSCLSEINSGNRYKKIKFDKDYPILNHVSKFSNLAVLIKKIMKRKSESIRDREIELYIKVIEKISSLSKNRDQQFIVGFIKAEKGYFEDTTFSNSIVMDIILETGANVIDMTLSSEIESLPDTFTVHPKYERHPSTLANYARAKLLNNYIGE